MEFIAILTLAFLPGIGGVPVLSLLLCNGSFYTPPKAGGRFAAPMRADNSRS